MERCINSLLIQDYSDVEIIAVNDCSTDHILERLKAIKTKLSFTIEKANGKQFEIIELEANVDIGVAGDCGIDQAMGEYIMFVDSDDWIACDTISTCASGAAV